MISAFTVSAPYLKSDSVKKLYSELMSLSFPDQKKTKDKSPSEILKELENEYGKLS
jgi:hypothetical protein